MEQVDPFIWMKRWNEMIRSGPTHEEQYQLLYQMPVEFMTNCIEQIHPKTRREFRFSDRNGRQLEGRQFVTIECKYAEDSVWTADVIRQDFYWFETLVPILGDHHYGTKQEGNNGWCLYADWHDTDIFKGIYLITATYGFKKNVKF